MVPEDPETVPWNAAFGRIPMTDDFRELIWPYEGGRPMATPVKSFAM